METFDVFLSHSSVDKEWVSHLKALLGRYGIKAWLDQDEIRPGDSFSKALEAALDQSKTVVFVISPEAVESGWVREEYDRALSLDKERGCRLIPVIYRNAQVPAFLKSRNPVDFTNPSQTPNPIERLIWGITGSPPELQTTGILLGDPVRVAAQRPPSVERFPLKHVWDPRYDRFLGKVAQVTAIDYNAGTVHLNIDGSTEPFPFEWVSRELDTGCPNES